MLGVPWAVHWLWDQKIRNEARIRSRRDRRTRRKYRQFDKHCVLLLEAGARQANYTCHRRHVATCHILALHVLVREREGAGAVLGEPSWREGEGADGSAAACQALAS